MKRILFLMIASVLCLRVSAQVETIDPGYVDTFEWVIETFSRNDAGFQYVLDKKGEKAYALATENARAMVREARDDNQFMEAVREWFRFFRGGHTRIYPTVNTTAVEEQLSDDEIRLRYSDSPSLKMNEKELISALSKRKNLDPMEGIWQYGNYRVGVTRDPKDKGRFIGFILEADGVYWTPGQIKWIMETQADGTYATEMYMRDHSPRQLNARFIFPSKNAFDMMGLVRRVYPESPFDVMESVAMRTMEAREPFIVSLSDSTLYLYIHTFNMSHKDRINNLLAENDSLLRSTPNLIINIFRNGGGGDASWTGILPYLYTNPITTLGVQIYATELNAQQFEIYAEKFGKDDMVTRIRMGMIADQLRENLGSFVNMGGSAGISTRNYKEVMPNPRNVAIIISRENQSSAEQFLLAAKQSRKVKLFGNTTFGALDVSNIAEVTSPDERFILGYTMSKSLRIPDFCIDDIGIQPDFFIDYSKGGWYEWITAVREVIEY